MRTRRGLRARYHATVDLLTDAHDTISDQTAVITTQADLIRHLQYVVAAQDRQAEAQREMIRDLGWRVHRAQAGPLGEAAPIPRVDVPDLGGEHDLLTPWGGGAA